MISVKWASVMAVVCGLAAAAIGIVVIDFLLGNTIGGLDVLFVPPADVAAAVLGGILWWTFIERPRCLTDRRATSAGFLVGLLAYLLT